MVAKVVKRDGRIVKYDPLKISIAVKKAMEHVGVIDDTLPDLVANKVTALISTNEISVEQIQDIVEDILIETGITKLAKEYILYRAKRSKERDIRDFLGIEEDTLKFGSNALALLDKRYLRVINGKKETPAQLFERVATTVSSVEKDKEKWKKRFYNIMVNRMFVPSSPILASAGIGRNCLFACFSLEIRDSIEEIFQAVKNGARIQQSGGGLGLHFSQLRPKNSNVGTFSGSASGPVSFMQVFDATSEVIKQGSYRRGGNLGLLKVSHADIVEFIQCKNDENKLNNFNISVALTDDFMQKALNDEPFDLIDPSTNKVVQTTNAKDLLNFIAYSAWLNGEPGIVFWDTVQKGNKVPNTELIVNLCSELNLLDLEACCLGSINLEKFVSDGKIIYSSLKNVIHHAVRFLDDVLDSSNYPLPEIEVTCKKYRKLGLGVMGFANMLVRLEIPYNSEEALSLGEKLMKFINDEAVKASENLAEEKGEFPAFKDCLVSKKRRNIGLSGIAPTGSIGMIAETSYSIEPIYSIVYKKSNILDGESFFEVNPVFEEIAKKEGWYSSELINKIIRNGGTVRGIKEVPEKWQRVFVTAYEVSPEYHLRMQNSFQKHVFSSISKTINCSYETTVDDVMNMIVMAHNFGLKGFTVFRNGSRTKQVLELCPECEGGACPIPEIE